MIRILVAAVALTACYVPVPGTDQTQQAISCSQTFCFPYTCGGGSCSENLSSDAQCEADSCDGTVGSTCSQAFLAADADRCRFTCRNATSTTTCWDNCMNATQRHCTGDSGF